MNVQQVKQRFGIIGNSYELNRAIDTVIQVAPTDLSVLITGESGTGKEVLPKIIHQYSSRKHQSYIAVNCGAIPEGTIDSELFGHQKGAFTGALSDRKGYFEVADKGTIFLDEIGELPLSTQVRLLRILETGEFMKVGSSKILKTDVRVVAATNINFAKAIEKGTFREDLFYRLNTVPINVIPLRNRVEDIPVLFRKFAVDFAEKYRMPSIRLSEDAVNLLKTYRWPGNVRQLKNIAEQVSIIEQKRDIDIEDLRKYLPYDMGANLPAIVNEQNEENTFSSEREILYKVLFDMKNDMNDLKKLVFDLMQNKDNVSEVHQQNDAIIQKLYDENKVEIFDPNLTKKQPSVSIEHEDNIIDTEEYKEESLSIEEKEKELIIKALTKHGGKRKNAAKDLGISERTLYRKLKEYQLDL